MHRLPADVRDLRAARASLRMWLTMRGVAGDDLDDVVLASSELLANAVAASPPGSRIDLVATWGDGAVGVAVTDQGDGLALHPDRPRPPVTQEAGRGLQLVRALTDHLEVLPGAGTTTVRFRREVDAGQARLTTA